MISCLSPNGNIWPELIRLQSFLLYIILQHLTCSLYFHEVEKLHKTKQDVLFGTSCIHISKEPAHASIRENLRDCWLTFDIFQKKKVDRLRGRGVTFGVKSTKQNYHNLSTMTPKMLAHFVFILLISHFEYTIISDKYLGAEISRKHCDQHYMPNQAI